MSESDRLFAYWQYASEDAKLDFKRDQYKFVGANRTEKSELLKDILAMTNAWGEGTGYIVIGVDETDEKPNTLIGISDHIDDASIQQFVDSKVNRVCHFRYKTLSYQGKTFGVIEMPVQQRPIYLTSNYGSLSADTVYVRRNTATEIAKPDEVAQMGAPVQLPEPELSVLLFSNQTGDEIVNGLQIEVPVIEIDDEIPDYREVVGPGYQGMALCREVNKDYYRHIIKYLEFHKSYIPIGVSIRNTGDKEAKNLLVELSIKNSDYSDILLDGEEAQEPEKDSLMSVLTPSLTHRTESEFSLTAYADTTSIRTEIPCVHAKNTVDVEGVVYLLLRNTKDVEIETIVYCDGASEHVRDQIKLSVRCNKNVYKWEGFRDDFLSS